MATQAEMDGLASKLVTSGPLSWVVAGCPVVALFKKNMTQNLESLGQPLDRNGCGDILRLWIGVNQDTREIFVTLTIRIRTSPVRKKTRRQGRLMFLIIPAESLRLHSDCVGYSSLGKLPPFLLDVPTDVESAKTQLLRMSLDLGSMTSDVIMPEYQCRPHVMPQAMTLLRKLKLLSEASSFRLYANQNAAIQTALQDVSSMLAGGESITTPSVVTAGFYPGGRSACKNLWLEQGWLNDTDHDDQKRNDAAGTESKEIPKSFDPQPPPPYESDTVLSHKFTRSDHNEEPDLPSTASFSPEQEARDLPQTASLSPHITSHKGLPAECLTNDLTCPIAGTNSSASLSQRPASLPRLPHSTPEPSLSPNYSATFLSGFQSASPLRNIDNYLEKQRGEVTREGSCLSVQVAASICDHKSSDHNILTRANTPSAIDRVPDSLTRKRLPPYSAEEGSTSPAKRLATAEATKRTLLFNGLNENLSPTVADTISHHDGLTTRESANNHTGVTSSSPLSQWLTMAWDYCPTAHYLFVVELLKYGAAISSNQAEEVATCHVNCTAVLLAHCAREKLAMEHIEAAAGQDCAISDETEALLRWLYTLRPGADMQIFDSLLQLSVSEQTLLHTSTVEDHAKIVTTYKQLKADIVSQTCTQLGQELLQKDKSAILTPMLREEQRCKV